MNAAATLPLLPARAAQALLGIALAIFLGAGQARAAEDSWTGTDKWYHLGFSTGIASGAYLGAHSLLDQPPPCAFWIGWGTAVSAGATKEIFDAMGLGDPSWKDFTYDLLGALLGAGLTWAIDRALE